MNLRNALIVHFHGIPAGGFHGSGLFAGGLFADNFSVRFKQFLAFSRQGGDDFGLHGF